jgi:hypothetical protein
MKISNPGDSTQLADPIGKDAIRYWIVPETDVFSRKNSRIRPSFRRNLCGRITPKKIRSISVESDYRILSKPPESYAWREPYNAGFYNGSSRILSESGNQIPEQITPKKIRYNPSKSSCRTTSDVAKYGI